MRGVTIRNKLILTYLVPTVALLLGGSLLVYREACLLLEAELGRRLTSLAEATVGGLPANDPRRLSALSADDTTTQQRMRDKLEAVRIATGVRRIFIFDRAYNALVDTRAEVRFGDPVFEVFGDRAEVEQVFLYPGRSASSVMFSGVDGVLYKNGYAPIRYEGQVVAALGVEGSAEFFAAIAELRYALGALLLVGLALIVLVSSLLARTLTQPIGALVDASRKLGRGDMSDDIVLARDDEFRTLADAFNDMRRDLLDRDQQMQMMLHGIAHEVRNPLGGMELFCGLLAEDLPPDTQESLYVAKIRKELDYLTRVVNDFLAFARNQPLDWSRFPARDLLADLVGLLAWDLTSRGVSLDFRLDDDALELTADRERLRQVLINLIRNAGQATAPGGRVIVWARTLRAPSLEHLPELRALDAAWIQPPDRLDGYDGWRVIAVQDSGKGIPPDALESIFKPFFTTKQKGSGLGLALTGKIVAEHGGGLAVASTLRPSSAAARDDVAPALMAALNTPEHRPNTPQPTAHPVGSLDDDAARPSDEVGSRLHVPKTPSDASVSSFGASPASPDDDVSWLDAFTASDDGDGSQAPQSEAASDAPSPAFWDDEAVPDDGIWDFSSPSPAPEPPAHAPAPREALLGMDEPLLGADEPLLGAGEGVLGAEEALLGADEAMLGAEEPMLGADEPMLGAEEPALGAEEPALGGDAAPKSAPAPLPDEGDAPGWGTVMVIMLPFCDAIESQEAEVPDGWLG